MADDHNIILHIEDTETDAEIVQRALKKHMKQSYRLERAHNMAEAESILRTVDNISVILLDLGLPDTNDRMDTFQRLEKAKRKAIPTIVLTSVNDRELAVDMVGSGAGDYVRKSRVGLDPESLCDAIEFVWCRENNTEQILKEKEKALADKDDVIHWMSGGYSLME